MIDFLLDYELLNTQEELRALISNDVKSFGDLVTASNREPKVLKPVLNRYINWFNARIAPKALKEISA